MCVVYTWTRRTVQPAVRKMAMWIAEGHSCSPPVTEGQEKLQDSKYDKLPHFGFKEIPLCSLKSRRLYTEMFIGVIRLSS